MNSNERHIGACVASLALALALALTCLVAASPSQHVEPAFASGSITIAKASKSWPVIYKLNGGANNAKQVERVKAGATVKVSKLKKPTRTGYSFAGWYKNKKLTKRAKTVQGTAKKSKRTLYAKWTAKTYTLTYIVNGGKLSGSYAKTYQVTKSKKLPKPVKSGYTFEGWYTDSKLTKAAGNTTAGFVGNKKLYAKWAPIAYSIVYVLDGGTLPADAPTTYSKEAPVETLPTPVRAGYSFIGWYSDAALTNLVTSVPATSKGNKMLFARWRERVLVAHRGLTANAPENSAQAFEDAADKGFREVELDVRFTSDGAPVLVHDATIPLLADDGTSYRVDVSSLTYEDIQSAPMALPKAGTDGNNLTTFDEAIATCKARGLMVTAHLKTSGISEVDTLMGIVEEHGMQDALHWLSGNLTVLRYIRACDPDAAVMYLHGITQAAVNDALEFAADGDVMISASIKTLTDKKVGLCKQAGLPIDIWTLPDETHIAQLDQFISTIVIDALQAERVPDPVV